MLTLPLTLRGCHITIEGQDGRVSSNDREPGHYLPMMIFPSISLLLDQVGQFVTHPLNRLEPSRLDAVFVPYVQHYQTRHA